MTTTVLNRPNPAPADAGAEPRARTRFRAHWRVAGRLVRWTLLTLLALVAVGVTALAALPVFGASLLIVTSGSMEPSIATGDGVVLVEASPGDIRPGDVISYQSYGAEHLTTHRVLSRHDVDGRLHFRTQGDANDAPDPDLAPADGVVGRVVFRLPGAGRVLLALPSARAQMLVLAGVGALIGLLQVRDLLRPPRTSPTTDTTATSTSPAPARTGGRAEVPADVLTDQFGLQRAVSFAGLILLGTALSLLVVTTIAVYAHSSSITSNSFATVDVVPPANVAAEFDCGLLSIGKGVIVSWDTVSGADGYEVARSDTSGNGYSTIATINDGATDSYKDTNVENSTTYYYVVRTVDGSWTSENSTEVSVTMPSSLLCLL